MPVSFPQVFGIDDDKTPLTVMHCAPTLTGGSMCFAFLLQLWHSAAQALHGSASHQPQRRWLELQQEIEWRNQLLFYCLLEIITFIDLLDLPECHYYFTQGFFGRVMRIKCCSYSTDTRGGVIRSYYSDYWSNLMMETSNGFSAPAVKRPVGFKEILSFHAG